MGDDKETTSFWRTFTQSDIRLLVVTFARTVAANVVTVLLSAVAVIPVHSSARPTSGSAPTSELVVGGILDTGFLVIAAGGLIQGLRRLPSTRSAKFDKFPWLRKRVQIFLGFGLVSTILVSLLFLLFLLGYATGIK